MGKYLKFLVILFIVVVATINCVSFSFAGDRQVTSSALLQNVEALASGEHSTYFCAGSGSVDCPNGIKVEYYRDNIR